MIDDFFIFGAKLVFFSDIRKFYAIISPISPIRLIRLIRLISLIRLIRLISLIRLIRPKNTKSAIRIWYFQKKVLSLQRICSGNTYVIHMLFVCYSYVIKITTR